ncbi:RHS repeat-associated core domain-containing protein [Kosakonia sacchari]|uniref:Insecticidal toxin complex protein TccC n=1 Tax=Kosakonia sacchari TaxID=1158459 RepID=A0A1G4X9U8_9ENTR|nr:RHS repeat-associated core domain-containing protein [Kosakonia sacchari]SCX37941.1 insecticidal toxin complex protein TccC [Kosakonia sacchari]
MSTSLYSKTPSVTVLDNRALLVRAIVYHRHPDTPAITEERITRHQFDTCGLPSQSADPRLHAAGLVNFSFISDLGGTPLRTQSVDAGTTVVLNDAAGRIFLQVSNIGEGNERSAAVTRTFQYEDASLPGRLLGITEQAAGENARATERFVWGGHSADEQSHNLAGQPVSHYDPAGLLSTGSVSLSGVPLSVTRQLLPDDAEADWQGVDASAWNDLLAGETYTTNGTVDAAGNVLTTTDAKGNLQRVAYDVAGLLKGSWLTVKGGTEQIIVKSLSYSAAGQKLREEHGNGVVTTYSYEAETQRLIGIKTERLSAAKVLQDLRYEYDPVGNVLVITNDAEETRFWRNQEVVPENRYTYDSLYQLISATGREMANAVQQGSNLPPYSSFDDATYTNYSRTYAYDNAGNLTKIQHSAPASGNNYTTSITVSSRSNRAVLSTFTENPADVDALFTAGGQQKQLLPGQNLLWTARQELQKVTPVTRDGAADDSESYRYDASSQRIVKITSQLTGNTTQTKRVIYLPGLELRSSATEELQIITVGEAGRAQVRVLHWESGQPDGISNDPIRYSYDNLTGSSSLEVDSSGELISQEEYYPYGGTALFAARSQLEADYKTIRYSGKEQDATGLCYYGYRYYQPWAGRWLSADPAGTVDGLNLFRMVRNNPITLHDNNGLAPVAKSLTAHVQRAGLQAEPVESYQDVFHAIFHVHGEAAYNEVWATLSESIPLSSSEPITREHMEAIADFIEKKEIISGMVYASTTPEDIPIDISEVQAHLHKIPLNILKKVHSLGQFITATNDNITNHPSRHHFKGITPRGWPDDLTWDSVPGVGAEGKGAAEGMHPDETIIALSQNQHGGWSLAEGHTSTSLVLHEYAHAIDRSLGEKALMGPRGTGDVGDFLSRRNSFISVWEQDLSHTDPASDDYYYWQGGSEGGAEEAFAEGFSEIYSGKNVHNWPNVKSYISHKMQHL